MNQSFQTFAATRGSKLSLSLTLALTTFGCVFLGGTPEGFTQTPKKPAEKASLSNSKTASSPGYLNKTPPPGLRFAAPPKPPVPYLPPLPITYDPQPIFSSDFAPPTADLPVTKSAAPPAQQHTVVSPSVTALASNFGTNRMVGQIAGSPVDLGSVSPKMLVRFFQNGKPSEVELLVTNAPSFQVPVREIKPSSSASYEVKAAH